MQFYKTVTVKEVRDFYNKNIIGRSPKIVFTGSIGEEGVIKLINKHLSGLKGAAKRVEGKIQQKSPPVGLRIILADKPSSTQSFILFAFKGMMRTDNRYESAYVTNTIFGGYFLSRLNMRLREEKGFTYGARSSIRSYLHDSIWVTSTSVQADATADTIKESLNVIKEMKNENLLKEEELNKAKGYVVKRFPIEYETIDVLHMKLIDIVQYELPLDSISKEYRKLKEVMREDILKIAADYFNENNIMIVVVGDKKKIFESLRQITPDITEVTPTGDEVKK